MTNQIPEPSTEPRQESAQLADRAILTLGADLARARGDFDRACVDGKTIVHVVLGNEAADLDSVFSSIAKAIVLRRTLKDGEVGVPLINVLPEDLHLRKDVLKVLDTVGISVGDLLFIDRTASLTALHAEGRLRLHLVDHNELAIEQQRFAPAVVGIVDHHVDAHYPFANLEQEKRVIQKCGSAATLLAEDVLHNCPQYLNAEMSSILLSTISVDTINFKEGGPGTALDIKVATELTRYIQEPRGTPNFDQLMQLREDVTGLSLQQILVKDIKVYQGSSTKYAITSLPKSVAWSPSEDLGFEAALRDLSVQRNLTLITVLLWEGATPNERRTIKLFTVPPLTPEPFVEKLMNDTPIAGSLVRGSSTSGAIATLFSSEMILRKQLQPILANLGL